MGTITAYNVKDYGAVGNGTTDDSDAIRDCIRDALAGPQPSEIDPSRCPTIYFPEGVYAIHDDGILSDWGSTDYRNYGMKFVGAGMGATSLKLITADGARWFWDNRNETKRRKLMLGVFQDLMFESDQNFASASVTPLANGFRIWSNGYEKQWRFVNCTFRNLNEAVRTDGSGNADQVKFFGCNFLWIKGAVLALNNNQSVANSFFGCDIQTYGDVIKVDGKLGNIDTIGSTSPDPYEVATTAAHELSTGDYVQLYNAGAANGGHFITVTGANTFRLNGTEPGGTVSGIPNAVFVHGGGGSVSVYGGSVTLSTDPDNASREKYILNAPGFDNGGQDFSFNSLKVEMYGLGTGCCHLGSTAAPHHNRRAVFRDCNFAQVGTAGTPRTGVKLGIRGVVVFDNCIIPHEWEYVWNGTSATYPGLIHMRECLLLDGFAKHIHNRIVRTGNFGRLLLENCRGFDFQDGNRYAINHDYNWKNAGLVDVAAQRSTAVLATAVDAFPSTGGNERSIILPEGAMLVGVHAYKKNTGSSTASYVLKVGNDDKTVVYASSDNAAHLKRQPDGSAGVVTTEFKDEHEVHVTDIWKDVGTSLNERTLRLWADPAGSNENNHTGGYAIVEYI